MYIHICIHIYIIYPIFYIIVTVTVTVTQGARVALAEFYGEFFSNADLHSFLDLSGLKPTILPDNNIVGDNPNNELNPG